MNAYSKVFIDTAPLVYFLQKNANFFAKSKEIFLNLDDMGAILALSDITITEYSVFPYKNNRIDLIYTLNNFIEKSKADVLHTTRKVADKAAKIRAEYPFFKTMDSLQLAFASVNDCDLFLTNDKQLRQFKELNCVTVEEFEIK
ncbi:MAG: PIN domain-containing protein [Selenomonadaceae bacterium]|nr:PIN domain-containing protein [Selenomonadaceae bacterium]